MKNKTLYVHICNVKSLYVCQLTKELPLPSLRGRYCDAVCPSMCVYHAAFACCISLSGEGNVLYLVLSNYFDNKIMFERTRSLSNASYSS